MCPAEIYMSKAGFARNPKEVRIQETVVRMISKAK
jgi:hypothetical protein